MSEFALPLVFTGGVICVWGFRAIRNGRVKVAFFQLRGRWSTMLFGINSALCGILMMLTGVAAAAATLDAESVETLAISGLYIFGGAWIIAFVLEAIARIGWLLLPDHAPADLAESGDDTRGAGRKRKMAKWKDHFASGALPLRWLRGALHVFLTSGSQLTHRVMLPPRAWDKQGLWRGADKPGSRAKTKPAAGPEPDDAAAALEQSHAANEGPNGAGERPSSRNSRLPL